MPSSLIFAGLVVLWLLILVPAVARRQQEVARLSPAVLTGRVLERPMRHRIPEVVMTERRDDGGATTVGELARRWDDVPPPRERDEAGDRPADERYADWWGPEAGRDAVAETDTDPDDELDDDLRGELDPGTDDIDRGPDGERRAEADEFDDDGSWEPPVARYRPGRGGFDPEAAAAAAHAKYAFRQRLVLALLVLLLGAGVCALLVSGVFWWVACGIGIALAGYLTYLRRQVRIEEAIRTRRTQRLAGTRRPTAADDPELDDWARRGSEAAHHHDEDGDERPDVRDSEGAADTAVEDDDLDEDEDWTADDGETDRIRGTGEPIGVLPARRRTVDGPESTEHESSLPRITAAPPPPIPAGTALVDVDDEEELDAALGAGEHRRAAGE
ncbi:MAG: hypothetical protein M3235_16010 [Actinomycetota bacterium]|nr:hypothetical protein [Actinomycetota bacterium]